MQITKLLAIDESTVLLKLDTSVPSIGVSFNNEDWVTVTDHATGEASSYLFTPPLSANAAGTVSINVARSDLMPADAVAHVVVVDGSTGKIGYNLLPAELRTLSAILDDSGIISTEKLPEEICLLDADGKLPTSVLPADVVDVWEDYT